MNQIELCEYIRKSIRQIIIDDGKRVISSGTGVVIDKSGTLLTAKHVVARNNKFYNGNLLVRAPSKGENIEYNYFSDPTLKIDINLPKLIHPINIDLAILKPKNKIETTFIPLYDNVASVGTDIIIGGYPDDVSLPLNFDEIFNLMNPDMMTVKQHLDIKFKYYMRQPLFKQGMIGCVTPIHIEANNLNLIIDAATYILDTDLTYGGSGGPIINSKGELLGIITRKGFTDASKFRIRSESGILEKLPSGIGYGLSHQLITKVYKI